MATITSDHPQWQRFAPWRPITYSPHSFPVQDRDGNTGEAYATTRVSIQRASGTRVSLEGELRISAAIPNARILARVEVAQPGAKRATPAATVVGYTLRDNKESRHPFRETVSATDVEYVNVAHYSAPWSELEVENAPGPIDITTGAKHVLIIPGLMGDMLRVKVIRDLLDAKPDITAQIWDWTDVWDRPRTLQKWIDINKLIRAIGARLARRLMEWRAHPHRRAGELHVLALSAGANVITVACEKHDGRYIIENPKPVRPRRAGRFFDSVTYLSGALSVHHDLGDVKRVTQEIYNYYSDKDDILTVAYPKIFGIFELNVKLSWPAIGRFGLWKGLPNWEHVTNQLAWLDKRDRNGCAEKLGNNGRHLVPGCLAVDYFTELILPIIEGGSPPSRDPKCSDEWKRELHPSYYQDQSGATIIDDGGGAEPVRSSLRVSGVSLMGKRTKPHARKKGDGGSVK